MSGQVSVESASCMTFDDPNDDQMTHLTNQKNTKSYVVNKAANYDFRSALHRHITKMILFFALPTIAIIRRNATLVCAKSEIARPCQCSNFNFIISELKNEESGLHLRLIKKAFAWICGRKESSSKESSTWNEGKKSEYTK